MTNHPNRSSANRMINRYIAAEMDAKRWAPGDRRLFRDLRMRLQSTVAARDPADIAAKIDELDRIAAEWGI